MLFWWSFLWFFITKKRPKKMPKNYHASQPHFLWVKSDPENGSSKGCRKGAGGNDGGEWWGVRIGWFPITYVSHHFVWAVSECLVMYSTTPAGRKNAAPSRTVSRWGGLAQSRTQYSTSAAPYSGGVISVRGKNISPISNEQDVRAACSLMWTDSTTAHFALRD